MQMLTLRPGGATPLHAQLARELLQAIEDGRWRVGEPIPSERELIRLTGVSRATVRHAIAALISQGRLRRVHGRGTFVAHPRLEQPLQGAYSFAAQIAALGRQLADRVVQRRVAPADPALAALLGVPAGEPLVHIQRLRSLDGAPLTLDSFFIAQRLCPDLLDAPLEGSLYQLLAERYQLPVLRASDTIEPAAADRATAFFLQVPPGAPLLFVERVGYTSNDLPLHVGRNHLRGDMCRFRVNLGAETGSVELKH